MEYSRDPKNQIYANMAFRLGKIVTQYEAMKCEPKEKFEVTLYLAVLQSLVTNCTDHIRGMTGSNRKNSIFQNDFYDNDWGIDKDCWVDNTFNEGLTLENFITRIRNSVSHPIRPAKKVLTNESQSTGFTTVKDGSDIIKKIRFTTSPDVNKNNQRKKYFDEKDIFEALYIKKKNGEWKLRDGFPEDTCIEQIEVNDKIEYCFFSDKKPFIRISIIDLSVKQLGDFIKNITNYLAQPTQENWDGETIKYLIAV